MKILLSIAAIAILLFVISCKSKKAASNEAETIDMVNKLKSEGYLRGVVKLSNDDGACPVVIDLDDPNYGYLLDPTNIDEEFRKNGLAVWVKYIPLRMQNRCDNAHPIEITEIKRAGK